MASVFDKIYQNSSILFQQTMVAIYGCWWYRRRFNSRFHSLVQEYRNRERWSAAQFVAYQEDRLKELFAMSQRSSYYARVFQDAHLPGDLNALEMLKHLPFLTKETLRTESKQLLTTKNIPLGTIIQRSSGTTGTPTEIYYSPEFHALELAVPEARNLNWAGVNYRSRRIMFGVRKVVPFDQASPPFWRFSPLENMAYASIYHLSPQNIPSYLTFLRQFHPDIVMGYPSALNAIAAYAIEKKDFPASAKAVITMSETLSSSYRNAIEEAWQCKVLDRYGAVEGCMFASQCMDGRYHVSPEVGILEILGARGQPCAPGELGDVICTGLQNTLQPLIRYRTGDIARWAVDQACPCGREMPIIEGVEGRFEDMCFTPDGRQILRFDTVFKGVKNIKEAQVVQEEIDLFLIYVVPAKDFGDTDVHKLQENMRLHAGNVITRVLLVTQLERSPSGKFCAVLCRLSSEQKNQLREIKKHETIF